MRITSRAIAGSSSWNGFRSAQSGYPIFTQRSEAARSTSILSGDAPRYVFKLDRAVSS